MYVVSDADWIKTLLAAFFGWALSSLSQYVLVIRERRQAISKALSDLLELRFQLLVTESAFEQVRKIAPVPPQAEPQLRLILEQSILPDSTQISKRYDESVSLIAAVDPLLGYGLRSKDLVRPLLKKLTNLAAAQDIQALAFAQQLQKLLLPHMEQEFNRVIKHLAWRRGPITRWKVGRMLKKPLSLPEKPAQEIATMLRLVAEQQQSANEAGTAPGGAKPPSS
jgi:hypothetical protein